MSDPITNASNSTFSLCSLGSAFSSVTNLTNLSLSTTSSAASGSSMSTGPSLTDSTPSSNSGSSSLPSRHVSNDGSIVIESHASSSSAPSSTTQTPVRLPHPLNTLVLSEKWMSTSANWTLFKDAHLFSISIFLSPEDAAKASAVCKLWKESLDKQIVWKKQYEIQGYAPIHPLIKGCLQGNDNSSFLPNILTIIAEYDEPRDFNYKAEFAEPIPNAIMPKDYATHFQDTQVLNPIPRPGVMRRENNQPNPEQPGKTIGETHIWTYRPRLQISGIVTMLTMNILEQLVKNPLQGHPTNFEYISPAISQEQRNASMGEEGWYLISKTVFEGTRNLPFDRQQAIVTEKGYEIPSGPDVILTALVWHVLKGEFLFGRNPLTYTRTTSLTANGTWRWVVGGFGPRGLCVYYDVDWGIGSGGLAGLRKFSPCEPEKLGKKIDLLHNFIK